MKNKENLQYFESNTMKGLYETMKDWQKQNKKRLLSTDIQQDGHLFTCIALTNPTEVVLCDGSGDELMISYNNAATSAGIRTCGMLMVHSSNP